MWLGGEKLVTPRVCRVCGISAQLKRAAPAIARWHLFPNGPPAPTSNNLCARQPLSLPTCPQPRQTRPFANPLPNFTTHTPARPPIHRWEIRQSRTSRRLHADVTFARSASRE